MLASASPLFQNVPGTFADPLGLADQQAPGVVSLIVARYGSESTVINASIASTISTTPLNESPSCPKGAEGDGPTGAAPAPSGHTAPADALPVLRSHSPNPASEASPPTYDTFVAASGGLVAVARTTPDYRFPIAPAAAVARFHEARDHGRAPILSLYAVSEADAAQFLETAFYAECLKVHVDGPGSADLVRTQLARCGCAGGLLEANDFSDPSAPLVRLAEVATDGTALDLDALLSGVRGRVLLYDRSKNQAVARDRASAPPDLAAAVAQADRLARARRAPLQPLSRPAEIDRSKEASATIPDPGPTASAPLAVPMDHPAGDPTEAVEATLRQRARPGPEPSPLSALVAELQGRTPPPGTLSRESPLPSGERQKENPSPATTSAPALPDERTAAADEPRTLNPEPASASEPHPLAPDLDRLRTDAYTLLEAAVGRDRAASLDAHVRVEHALPSPVPPEHTLTHLRALLFDNPPKRWHLFKRARAKTHGDVAALLLAFHAAHGHDTRPLAQAAVMEATQLWTRLHR